MPELTTYPFEEPGLLDELGKTERSGRAEEIERAWRYYRRQHKAPLKVKPGTMDDNVIVNMARTVVNQSVSMLFGTPPTVELDEAKDVPEETILQKVLKDNGGAILLQKLGTQGALAGHCFVKLSPDAELGVRLVRLDPKRVTVFWRADDYEQVTCYQINWREGETALRQDIVDLQGSWLVRDLRRDKDASNWTVSQETAWPWPWPPIVDWQNLPDAEMYYGQGDLVNPELNDSVNFLASNAQRVIKFHGHPRTIGVGVQANDIKATAVDGFWAIPNPQAEVFNLEMKGDLASTQAFLQFLQGSFWSEHNTVDLASMKDRLGQLTNFGLRVLFHSALDKLEQKQALYGDGIVEISRRVLLLLEQGEWQPRVVWADPLPTGKLELIQELAQEHDLGIVSLQTAAADAGRDWDVEQERKVEEEAAAGNVGELVIRAFNNGQDLPSPQSSPAGRGGQNTDANNGLARGDGQ